MPRRPEPYCTQPGCPNRAAQGRCDDHPHPPRPNRPDDRRPSASARGYDHKWNRNRTRFIRHNPNCVDCGAKATDADHDPTDRRTLIALGDPNPDAWHHLKPRCHSCHSRRTAKQNKRTK